MAEIHQEMSELLHKQVNTQIKKSFRGPRKLPQAHEKCAMKMKQRRKNDAHLKVIDGRKPFITPKQKTGKNDLHKLLGNDCGYNEGTICVVNGYIGWFFERGRTNGCIKLAMAGTQD